MMNSMGISESRGVKTEVMEWVRVTQLVCVFLLEAAVAASLGCLQFSVLGRAQMDSHIQVQALVPACSGVE